MDSKTLDMLGGVLSDPKTLENIKGMLGSITGDKNPVEETQESNTNQENNNLNNQIPDINFLANILSGNEQSVAVMNKMKKAYDTFNNARDPGINLINALSPYLSTRRAMNADKLITALKVSKAVSVFREE